MNISTVVSPLPSVLEIRSSQIAIRETPSVEQDSQRPVTPIDKSEPSSNKANPGASQQESEARQKSDAEQALAERRELLERNQIRELAARDREVRTHEQAHASVGGQYAGAPTYQFQRGPDGVSYAVGGEVSIDVSAAGTPEETIRKMQIVRAAALAPSEPSSQDRRVAAQAAATLAQAQSELATERADSGQGTGEVDEQASDNTEGSKDEPSYNIENTSPSASDVNSSSVAFQQFNRSVAAAQGGESVGQIFSQRV